MSLKLELGLNKPVALLAHEALLSTYYTASNLRKKAGHFLQPPSTATPVHGPGSGRVHAVDQSAIL